MISKFGSLALNGFREARRNRVSVVVAAFAIGLLAASTLVTQVTLYSYERVLTDVGLGAMSFAVILLAIFLSSGLLAKEIEKRTIFLMVSKPVSRTQFLLARFAGIMLTLAAIIIAMGLVFWLEVRISGFHLRESQVAEMGMLWFEALVVSAIGFAISANSSQTVSAVVATGLYFAGHLDPDIYSLSQASHSMLMQHMGKAVYYVIPNLARLNFRPMAAYQLSVSGGQFVSSAFYGCAYAAALLAIAAIVFSRRDFK